MTSVSPPLASTLLKQLALTRVARRVNNLATVVFGHHRLLKDGGDGVSKRHLKEIIFKIERESLLKSCAVVDKAPLVAKIAQEVGWKLDGRWYGMQPSVEEDDQLGDCSYL